MTQAGVYTILNLVTGRAYVGSSVNVAKRWREHLSMLSRGVHVNDALQADWTRYGSQSFSWTLTQECATRVDAIRAEQTHIDTTSDLYNAARRAGSGPRDGFRHSEAMKRRQSEAMRGRPKPLGFGAKVAAWRTGQSIPKPSLRGRSHSPEHCQKISIGNTGKQHTAAHKAHMRDLMMGRIVTWGEKISAGKKGKPWSAHRRALFEAKQATTE